MFSRSHHRGGGAQHSTLPSSATFSSFFFFFKFVAPNRTHAVFVHETCVCMTKVEEL